MITFQLQPTAPYDFHRMIKRLQGVGHEMFCYEEMAVRRTIRIEDTIYFVSIQSLGNVEHPLLAITAYSDKEAAQHHQLLEQHMKAMLSTKLDLAAFYDHIQDDTVISTLAQEHYGLRFILEANLFECMVKTIIGQQINLAFAATLNKRLMSLTTIPVNYEGVDYPVFPSPQEVASLSYEQLREQQFSQRKAEYVIDFARAIVEGHIDLEAISSMEDEEIITYLSSFRGIGRWSVECFLLFGLGRTNLLPAADIGLRNAVKKNYQFIDKPTEAHIREIGKSWSPWSSYVTFYLWESLNQKK